MSGIHPIATEQRTSLDVRKVPNSEVALLARSLIGAGKQQRQNGAAERTARG
jgi:hypothetical protein